MRINNISTSLKGAFVAAFSATVCVFVLVATATAAPVQSLTIERIGGTPAAGETAAEISAYLPSAKRVYVTNSADNSVDIFSLANPASPVKVGAIDLSPYGAGPNSVAVSKLAGGRVAVAVEASPKTDPGKVVLFNRNGAYISQVTVGAQPDMIVNNHEIQFVVANEGEPADDGSIDPKGTISVINMIGPNWMFVRTAGFDHVNIPAGVRIFGPQADPSRNIEPEYVAISPTGLRAQVTLQEANAIATIDLLRAKVISVKPLGFKDYSLPANKLDASDRDGAVNIRNWDNLFGMYQPDAIAMYRLPGKLKPFYITANEGDARDWDYYSEEERVKDLPLDPVAFPAGTSGDSQLGRLNVTTSMGDTDNDGDFDELYTFGGRSVSVLDSRGSLQWDSGDALEQYAAATDPARFNIEGLQGGFDSRSDNKGPEPEGIATGKVGNRIYAFVGNERQNTIIALDLQAQPGKALIAGGLSTLPDDESPEGIEFIPASESPNRKPLLLSTNEVSGTLGVFSVKRP
ncbi:MAG: choice-of-anchor I family protein [Solirubrobacterales bacterium]